MSKSNEYTLDEHERRHIAEIEQQLDTFEQENRRLKGMIYGNEQEMSFMRRHLSLHLGTVAAANGLPMGARLTADKSKLVAPAESGGNGPAAQSSAAAVDGERGAGDGMAG